MRTALMQAIAWISHRHMVHFEANKNLAGAVGAFFMRLVNQKEFDYYKASYEQQGELTELKALSAALEIKHLADNMDGWQDHHGIGLNMIAGVLMEQTEWEPEDVDDFVDRLTEGFFSYGGGHGFDEDLD